MVKRTRSGKGATICRALSFVSFWALDITCIDRNSQLKVLIKMLGFTYHFLILCKSPAYLRNSPFHHRFRLAARCGWVMRSLIDWPEAACRCITAYKAQNEAGHLPFNPLVYPCFNSIPHMRLRIEVLKKPTSWRRKTQLYRILE